MKRIVCIALALLMALTCFNALAIEVDGITLPEYIEITEGSTGPLGVEKDSPVYNWYKDMLGFGIIEPYIEWNGGTTYMENINMRIAAGDAPNAFHPVNGAADKLILEGACTDLTDLIAEYAPHVWETVPEATWNIIRANDPTGQGRIWYIPAVVNYTRHGAMIRQDWLDKLGLDMPTTQEEFVEVLRAFKTEDPNGNGVADELPTGGRAEARWMDYLFNMYGIAMFEGYPRWDLYDGELTYSAVTQNMKDALQFISELYAEGLLDSETLLNSKADWDGKVKADVVGVFYQWPQQSYQYALDDYNATGNQPQWVVLPAISADGYEGQAFYQSVRSSSAEYVLSSANTEAQNIACLMALDFEYNLDNADTLYMGVEGMHSVTNEDGTKTRLAADNSTQQLTILDTYNVVANPTTVTASLKLVRTEENAWAVDQAIQNVADVQQYGKIIAGNDLPDSVYEGYEDIQNRVLYVEYASKIISGEWSIDKFDEFVELWYANGGEAVTERAREWYANQAQ